LSHELGFEMHLVLAFKKRYRIVSSTGIRQLVAKGQVDKVQGLLGRPFFVTGKVVQGAGRGRMLGVPTANVAYEESFGLMLPCQGVYVVKVVLGKKVYQAVANLGTRPSFDNQISRLYLEVYILDFSKNIYGCCLKVEFLKRIRQEKKFARVQDLMKAIKKDKAFAKAYFLKDNVIIDNK
ncbi:MAG: hypothetical protein HQL13_07105, partial [Candidatus Omnitrophica bacterium]|nr:hypothetical protein [Candidatus Omnitrophota bacterium]